MCTIYSTFFYYCLHCFHNCKDSFPSFEVLFGLNELVSQSISQSARMLVNQSDWLIDCYSWFSDIILCSLISYYFMRYYVLLHYPISSNIILCSFILYYLMLCYLTFYYITLHYIFSCSWLTHLNLQSKSEYHLYFQHKEPDYSIKMFPKALDTTIDFLKLVSRNNCLYQISIVFFFHYMQFLFA